MKSLYNRITSWTTNAVDRYHGWVAGALLLTMGVLGLGSMLGNSATFDEVAHIPAGYSYLHFGDYRLNPEHPPLIKDLAAIPLQFMDLKFPSDQEAWTSAVNGQWDTGRYFIYHLGNDADAILFWARLPILLLALGFGVFLYGVCRRHWGTAVGLLALFFYCLSPNILAHATLVTTDVGVSAVMFVAIVAFARFMKMPSRMNLWLLALALTFAELVKFSAVMLYPLLGLVALWLAWTMKAPKLLWDRLVTYVGGFIGASALSMVGVWLYYMTQIWQMPLEVQDRLIAGQLKDGLNLSIGHILVGMDQVAVLRPLTQYLLGVVMVFGRVAAGGVTYFNGQASAKSFHLYFPELFALKTQVALLIMLVLTVGFALWRHKGVKHRAARLAEHFRGHILEWTLGIFGLFYFVVAVAGNLNLGLRHILPIYIPLFVLVALGTVKMFRYLAGRGRGVLATAGFGALLVWYGLSTILVYPSYLSYFNEIAGGAANADNYFSDSNVDWGQDLKRLKTYVNDHSEIKHIAVDYFGGGEPAYYFCQRRFDTAGKLIATPAGYDCSHSVYENWHSQNGEYTGQYIAVSETYLENDRYYAAKNHVPSYSYLRARTPIAKIGGSIYVYKLY